MARALPAAERLRLAQELARDTGSAFSPLGTLAARPAAAQSAAWVKSEQGHAVLATDTGPAEADIPAGPEAIAGMWADLGEASP